MDRYMHSILDVIVDRTAEGLIGAILVALVLALLVSGAFALLRKRVNDTTVLLTCLGLTANVVAMALAGGYIQFASTRGGRNNTRMSLRGDRFPPGGGNRGPMMAARILATADADHDGVLSLDEAVAGVERFMKDAGQGRPLDEEMLRGAIRDQLDGAGLTPPPRLPED